MLPWGGYGATFGAATDVPTLRALIVMATSATASMRAAMITTIVANPPGTTELLSRPALCPAVISAFLLVVSVLSVPRHSRIGRSPGRKVRSGEGAAIGRPS